MSTREDRIKYLDICDAPLGTKPRLASVYDQQWRQEFRAEILALPDDSVAGYPAVYWLPMLHRMNAEVFPVDLQERVEYALGAVWDQISDRDRADMTGRLRKGDFSALEELLAAAAFAKEFGRAAIIWPNTRRDERRPEFFVESDGVKWAVECRHLQDRREIRDQNEIMLQTGESWVVPAQPDKDRQRLCRAIVKKIHRAQGDGPTVILLTSLTPWLMPEDMEEIVRLIFDRPSDMRLSSGDLPIAIACFFLTVVQGVWFCDDVCAKAGITVDLQDRIRAAIMQGFVERIDTVAATV